MNFMVGDFSNPVRTLTATGAMLGNAGIASTSIPASSSVDLRPAANFVTDITIGVKTGAAATAATTINIWDGTTPIIVATTAAGALASIGFGCVNNNSFGARITNTDAAVAATYTYSGLVWVKS